MKKLLSVLILMGMSSATYADSFELDNEALRACGGTIELRGKGSKRFLEVNTKYCSKIIFSHEDGSVIDRHRMQDRNNGFGGNYILTATMRRAANNGRLKVTVRSNGSRISIVYVQTTGGSSYKRSRRYKRPTLPKGWEVTWSHGRHKCYVWNEYDETVSVALPWRYCEDNNGSNRVPPQWEYSWSVNGGCYLYDSLDRSVQLMVDSVCRRWAN